MRGGGGAETERHTHTLTHTHTLSRPLSLSDSLSPPPFSFSLSLPLSDSNGGEKKKANVSQSEFEPKLTIKAKKIDPKQIPRIQSKLDAILRPIAQQIITDINEGKCIKEVGLRDVVESRVATVGMLMHKNPLGKR